MAAPPRAAWLRLWVAEAHDNLAHQCGVCLQVGHGAWDTAKCPKQGGGTPPGTGRRFQKGGKAGDKGGGKGGRRGRGRARG